MQDHDVVVIGNLVDQVRRPQNGDAVIAGQRVDVLDDVAPCGNVQPDGRFIQQQLRPAPEKRRPCGPAPAKNPPATRLR